MFSIDKVCDELLVGKDDLADWVRGRKNNGMFLNTKDEATQKAYGEIIKNIVDSNTYTKHALDIFFKTNNADPWLIAADIGLEMS